MIDCAAIDNPTTLASEATFSGRKRDPLFSPSSIAVLRDGSLLVTHELGHQLWHLNDDLSLRAIYGSFGKAAGQFHYPAFVSVAGNGVIAVADKWNHRIQLFDERMAFIRSIGQYGNGDDCFYEPGGVACGNDKLYIADKTNGRVVVTDYNGKVIVVYANNNPLPGFYSGKTFKANQHYLGWLARCSRFHSMLDQFVFNGFKVGLLEYPENVIVTGDKVVVIDKVGHHCVEFSPMLAYRQSIAVRSLAMTCCAYSAENDRWLFGSEFERLLVVKHDEHECIIDDVRTRCAAVAVVGDTVYTGDFWDGIVTKYRMSF